MELSEAKQVARAVWSAGEYDEIAEYIWSVGGDLVERLGLEPGASALDVACGTGNATIPAAQAGARAVGLDLTPKLLEQARRRAAGAGVEIEWIEGDAEALPFDDGSFDVVLSTFGCMFAPDHRRTASEMARVLRPGGKLGVAAWTPDGEIGRFFGALASFGPPPPPDFEPPPLWGTEEHVSEIFSGTGVELRFERAAVHFEFESVDAALAEYVPKFGPLVMLKQALEPEGRWPEAEAEIRRYYEQSEQPDGRIVFEGDYLITLGAKAG